MKWEPMAGNQKVVKSDGYFTDTGNKVITISHDLWAYKLYLHKIYLSAWKRNLTSQMCIHSLPWRSTHGFWTVAWIHSPCGYHLSLRVWSLSSPAGADWPADSRPDHTNQHSILCSPLLFILYEIDTYTHGCYYTAESRCMNIFL